MSLSSYQHGVYQNLYHLVFVTKYRYQMMRKPKYREAVKDALIDAALRHGIKFLELVVMNDHVHVIAECHPSMSQAKAINLLKGASAKRLFEDYPNLSLRYPRHHFWTAGKAGRSVGDADKETVVDYVRRQAEQTILQQF